MARYRGRYLESPHMYKINGLYYLLAAEGGTEYGHMETYARGSSVSGPFEAYPHNPVLTNRNLGGYELQGVGHGDLVQDVEGIGGSSTWDSGRSDNGRRFTILDAKFL